MLNISTKLNSAIESVHWILDMLPTATKLHLCSCYNSDMEIYSKTTTLNKSNNKIYLQKSVVNSVNTLTTSTL